MPKTNAKVTSVDTIARNVIAKITSVSDNRSKLSGQLKATLASKDFADFNKQSVKIFLAVKKVEEEIKELPPLIATLKSEITSLNKLVTDKGKSLTYRAQLMASKSKATAFKGVVQWTKDVGDYRDQAEHFATTLRKEDLGETFYKLRGELEKLDPKKFAAEAPKKIKKLMEDLEKSNVVAAGGQAVVADAKRLSADPDLDDDE